MTHPSTRCARALPALLALAAVPAFGQYPDRPIRLIVPFATGSATDTSARLYALQLSSQLGQQVIADNRPGAGGAIGLAALAKSKPDGYTLAYAGAGPLAINRSVTPNLPYDVEKDLQPISQAVSAPLLVAVSPTLPVKNVADLVRLAKARPGELANGSAGTGTIGHLAGEYFKMTTGTKILHVPYKGGAQAATEAITGFVQILFDPATSTAATHVRSGKLRGIAVTGARRAAAFPDLPTVAESGVPNYEVTTWGGLVAPAGIPADIARKLSEQMHQAAKSKLVTERYGAMGAEPLASTPEAFAGHIRSEYLKWAKVVKAAGIGR